jgi:hypothetical protein
MQQFTKQIARRMPLNRLVPTLAVGLLFAGVTLADGNKDEIRLRTQLSGGAIGQQTPSGSADFRNEAARNRSRLNVEVEHVNLPDGTMLEVFVTSAGASTRVGEIHLRLGFGEIEFNSQDGAAVPSIAKGDMVTVRNAGVAILSGVF